MKYQATYCNDNHFTSCFNAKSTQEAIRIAIELHPEHYLSDLCIIHELPTMLYLLWIEELHDDGDRTPRYETVWAWCSDDAVRRVKDKYSGKMNVIDVFITTKTSWSK